MDSRSRVPCTVYRVERGCWPSLCQCSPPSLYPVCSTLCSNGNNCLLARHIILQDFYDTCSAWYMALVPWVDLILCSLNQLERLPTLPFDWGKLVYSVANQNPVVDATCSLKIERPGCAENQALANHRCSVEHVLLHALVKYTIQLALQNTFSYTCITMYFGP